MQVEAVSISHLRTIYLAHSLTILTEALADLAFEYEEVCMSENCVRMRLRSGSHAQIDSYCASFPDAHILLNARIAPC